MARKSSDDQSPLLRNAANLTEDEVRRIYAFIPPSSVAGFVADVNDLISWVTSSTSPYGRAIRYARIATGPEINSAVMWWIVVEKLEYTPGVLRRLESLLL